MARFRVRVHTESLYMDTVEAPSPAEAGTMVGDKVRAGELKPFFDRPSIAKVEIHRIGEQPERPDPR